MPSAVMVLPATAWSSSNVLGPSKGTGWSRIRFAAYVRMAAPRASVSVSNPCIAGVYDRPRARNRPTLATLADVSTVRALTELVHPSWAAALAPVTAQVTVLGAFLRAERVSGRGYLPAGEHILRAFAQPHEAVRV